MLDTRCVLDKSLGVYTQVAHPALGKSTREGDGGALVRWNRCAGVHAHREIRRAGSINVSRWIPGRGRAGGVLEKRLR